ncbi:hypothetical protein B0W47_04645 [Komagataeibacter nataicola]|uniref:Uncharacterized protein n=2 Tax=Komagataeibacter nataicola TaxID=265960 RepID=A0A9N7C863_9PROT|nr:hypothetical protein B0W47_04645 [Komagataeibacter nataicola]PYD67889.1 hypothetical protein CDI09_00700 [Komagataeibacter nataicola]
MGRPAGHAGIACRGGAERSSMIRDGRSADRPHETATVNAIILTRGGLAEIDGVSRRHAARGSRA